MGTPRPTDRKWNILVVDDTPINLKLLSELLVKQGYKVRAARDGEMAIMSAQINIPDLILLDIRMPGMDGYEVCTRIKADPATSDIPIIFISALNDTDDIVHAFEVGGVDYVTKPFKFREVLARVENHLTIKWQREQIAESADRERAYLQTVSKMKDQFISAATHDLKNPLALILGYASLLETHELAMQDRDIIDWIEGIKRGSEKMLHLVSEMLELIQIESHMRSQSTMSIPIQHLLANCVEGQMVVASRKNIQIHQKYPENEILVGADIAQMERVFDNLISNAIKYTEPGGNIEITVENTEDTAIIIISDTGYGIPQDSLPMIFDPFYRVRAPHYGEIEGTGLGLSIVKAIIEQHQGTIQVASEVDQGSTFTVVLPIVHDI